VRVAPNREIAADWRDSPWGGGGRGNGGDDDRKHAEDRTSSGLGSGGGVASNEERGEGTSGADEKERDGEGGKRDGGRWLLNARRVAGPGWQWLGTGGQGSAAQRGQVAPIAQCCPIQFLK
jgi:hypothetical protein